MAAESVRDHSFLPRRRGKKEGIFASLGGGSRYSHVKKILGKMAGQRAHLGQADHKWQITNASRAIHSGKCDRACTGKTWVLCNRHRCRERDRLVQSATNLLCSDRLTSESSKYDLLHQQPSTFFREIGATIDSAQATPTKLLNFFLPDGGGWIWIVASENDPIGASHEL